MFFLSQDFIAFWASVDHILERWNAARDATAQRESQNTYENSDRPNHKANLLGCDSFDLAVAGIAVNSGGESWPHFRMVTNHGRLLLDHDLTLGHGLRLSISHWLLWLSIHRVWLHLSSRSHHRLPWRRWRLLCWGDRH